MLSLFFHLTSVDTGAWRWEGLAQGQVKPLRGLTESNLLGEIRMEVCSSPGVRKGGL